VLYFGSTSPAMREALDALETEAIHVDAMRLQAFPFPESVGRFIAEHDKVFVAEQNRDGQMRSLLINELDIDPARLVRVLHYDGTPITARFIANAIRKHVQAAAAAAPVPASVSPPGRPKVKRTPSGGSDPRSGGARGPGNKELV